MRTRQEQIHSAFCHLFNAIPLWGLLFCGLIWFSLREESRVVVRQAQQAINFHMLLMGGLLIWLLLETISRILGVLSPTLREILSRVNGVMIALVLLAYVATCLYGFARCLSGQRFRYPLVLRRRR
jgi:uncharacterized Tic20 family protein